MERFIHLNGEYIDRVCNTAKEMAFSELNAAIAAVWDRDDGICGAVQDVHLINRDLEYHRKPTKSEINFGEGATHYKDFSVEIYRKADGTIKKRLKGPYDGLIYTRI